MAETKKYIAKRARFSIIRPPTREKVMQGDEVVTVHRKPPPIEFSGGTYTTSDPEEIEAIESNDAFSPKGLEHGDVAPHPGEQELEEAAEEAPPPATGDLQDRLDAADSTEERKEILREAGYPGLADDLPTGESGSDDKSAETSDEGGETEAEAGSANDDLTVISGVSNKSDALNALDSIEGVDFDVNTSDNVDAIAEEAESKGYTFADWP